MPVDTHCPSQRRGRRGVAQFSLSSLHGANTFHVNHNCREDQPRQSLEEKHSESQVAKPGVIDDSNDTLVGDESVKIGVTLANATSPSESISEFSSRRNLLLLRRRRKRKIQVTTGEDKVEKQPEVGNDFENCDSSKKRKCDKATSPPEHSKSEEIFSKSDRSAKVIDASPFDHCREGVHEILDLKEICSVGYFKATPLDEFRRRCRDCLKQHINLSSTAVLLEHSSSTSNPRQLLRYDSFEIIRRLTNDIDWKSMCEHHDKREYKRQRRDSKKVLKTALSEIVLAVTDKLVIPYCCRKKCLVDILLNALLISPSLSVSLQSRRRVRDSKETSTTPFSNKIPRWTPSQQLLLETIRMLLLASEIDPSMSDYVRKFVLSRPSFLYSIESEKAEITMNKSGLSPNKANRLLSAIYWMLSSSLLAQSFSLSWEKGLLSSGLLLLQRIDGWSIQIDMELQKRKFSNEDKLSPDGCGCCGEDGSDRHFSGKKNGLHRPSRKMTVDTLPNLHDDDVNIEKQSTFYYHNKAPWRRSYGDQQRQVSLKNVLSMKQKHRSAFIKRCSCNRIHNSQTQNQKETGRACITTISSDWSTVRSRAYKKFVSYSAERRRQQHLHDPLLNDVFSPRTLAVQNSDEAFLWWLVNDIALHSHHSSQRACIALVAYTFGGPKNSCYFKYVANLYWQGYLVSSLQRKSASCHWLRLYSEWISECAVFDERQTAWEVLQPMFLHVTGNLLSRNPKSPNGSKFDSDQVCDIEEDPYALKPSLMACLACILHKRSHLFESFRCDEKGRGGAEKDQVSKPDIEDEFRSFMNLIAIHCGESSELWLGQFSGSTRDLVESTLQRLGVLSFSVTDSRTRVTNSAPKIGTRGLDESTVTMMDSLATSNWPYGEEFSLRRAMGRIDRAVFSLENGSDALKSLLSQHSKGGQLSKEEMKVVKSSKTKAPTVPLTNFLYDDGILCLIFSFCGSKRLTKIPQVCKAWKTVSDTVSNSLWESAYVADFGNYRWPSLDAERQHRFSTCPLAFVDFEGEANKPSKRSNTYWKNLFTRKQIAEKMVRFQRHSRTGYKYRTCNYVGCLHVLKTAEQERKHDKMHLRVLAKQKAALKKNSEKKRKKNGTKSIIRDSKK